MGRLLSLETIEKAINGDAEAASKVVAHYSRYISYLSHRYGYYDVEASCRMESQLLYAILKFHLD